MSLFKVTYHDDIYVPYYTKIQSNIKTAIDRIHKFTKSSEFEEADNILLEIKLGLLETYFIRSIQCNDLLLSKDSQEDNSKNIEDLFIEIKTKIKRKLLSNSEIVNVKPSVQTAVNIPIFDGSKESYKAFIDVFNDQVERNTEYSVAEKLSYLKSSLSKDVLALVENIELNNDDIYKEMLDVLKRRYDPTSQSKFPAQQKDNKMSYDKNPAHIAYLNEMEVTEELYKNIVQASYSYAVKVSRNISSSGHGSVITNVVLRLAQEGNKNLLSYVYLLWSGGDKDIIEKYMPDTFKMIFSDWVSLIQKKFGLALKMDANVDGDGDRIIWGDSCDKTSRRVNWKLIPFWENNRVYFHIKNMEHDMYMKLEVKSDDIGDRGAFGSNASGTERHAWVLEPVVIDDTVLFYIYNRQFNQGLKLQSSTDSIGDRKLWGHNGNVYNDPPHFAWSIHSIRS